MDGRTKKFKRREYDLSLYRENAYKGEYNQGEKGGGKEGGYSIIFRVSGG